MDEPVYRPSHFGMCVTNLTRSLAFYCDGLGFEKRQTVEVDTKEYPAFYEYMGMPSEGRFVAQFIRHPISGMRVELLAFEDIETIGRPTQVRHSVGLTHIAFSVEDVDSTVDRLKDLGGTIFWETRGTSLFPGDQTDHVFVGDPDGIQIELHAHPELFADDYERPYWR